MSLEEMNRNVIEEFRRNNGKVSGQFEGMPLLLINSIGAKSGEVRTKPLAYYADGERYVIIASFAGAKAHPPWYHNLVANPEIDIEVGPETFRAKAEVIPEPERTELYAKITEQMPIFATYQEKTERVIPLIGLNRL